jgi:hypothetical protein
VRGQPLHSVAAPSLTFLPCGTRLRGLHHAPATFPKGSVDDHHALGSQTMRRFRTDRSRCLHTGLRSHLRLPAPASHDAGVLTKTAEAVLACAAPGPCEPVVRILRDPDPTEVELDASCEPDRWPTGRLSWGSSPLRRSACPSPLPAHRSAPSSGLATSRCVPSPRFLTTSTASSTGTLRACCIPLPTMGFVAVPLPLWPRANPVSQRQRPHDATTPRRSPHPTAVPRHRGRTPLAVPPCAHSTEVEPAHCRRLQGLAPSHAPDLPARLPCLTDPLLPGLFSPSRSRHSRCPPFPRGERIRRRSRRTAASPAGDDALPRRANPALPRGPPAHRAPESAHCA